MTALDQAFIKAFSQQATSAVPQSAPLARSPSRHRFRSWKTSTASWRPWKGHPAARQIASPKRLNPRRNKPRLQTLLPRQGNQRPGLWSGRKRTRVDRLSAPGPGQRFLGGRQRGVDRRHRTLCAAGAQWTLAAAPPAIVADRQPDPSDVLSTTVPVAAQASRPRRPADRASRPRPSGGKDCRRSATVDDRESPPRAEFKPAWQVERFTWPRICRRLIGRAADELDRLADALLTANAGGQKVLAIAGCRQGEGATTLLLCAARRLAERGVKAVLVDADRPGPGWPSVWACSRSSAGTTDRRTRPGRLDQAVVEATANNLALVPFARAVGRARSGGRRLVALRRLHRRPARTLRNGVGRPGTAGGHRSARPRRWPERRGKDRRRRCWFATTGSRPRKTWTRSSGN